MRWILLFTCLGWFVGCSLVDRQKEPQILDIHTDQDTYQSIGRSSKVRITLFTDDPDNDELDFLWRSTGGKFEKSGRDTLVDLFQDSVSVVWVAPGNVGLYDLLVEVTDGKSGVKATSSLQMLVTQVSPVAVAGENQTVVYSDALRILLDGTQSYDPERDKLNFIWKQVGGPGVDLASGGSGSPSFPALAPADYVFILQVSDDAADTTDALTSSPDTVVVRVSDREGRGP
ncbi:MAG: hypothetical protein O2954_02445 [bacterium]|nr:hypothetical protein [bacterium]